MNTLPATAALLILAMITACASTLPPEMKAYDFAQAYYIEDGGIVIVPYAYGFSCPDYVKTPEGLRVMPGGTFSQYDPQHRVEEDYRFAHLSADGTQAYFDERIYACEPAPSRSGRPAHVRVRLLGRDNFYLSQFRGFEWFDFVFGDMELHPGLAEWQSKNWRYVGGRGAF